MRILVCGGRDCTAAAVFNWLDHELPSALQATMGISTPGIDTIIHGGARGADEGAGRWGRSEGIRVVCYPANWKRWGHAAGPIRNQRMIDEGKPDVVIAFPGGAGTADMVRRAEAASIPIIRTDSW